MRLSVVGTGYVGLVSGACLAETGHEVICVDVDPGKVERINRADPPIHERGLAELLKRNVGMRLRATTDLAEAVRQTDLSLIAVGTPFKGGEIDLTYIQQAATDIGEALKAKPDYHVVVVKSTVVPGTTEYVVTPALAAASRKQAGTDFGVGVNPEFLREGEAIDDFMAPDRIVMGGIDERTLDALDSLYAVFDGVAKIRTTPRTAELIKYTANSLLATMISFSNEIANLATALGGIDVVEVMRGVHLDKRLTPILPDGRRVVPGITTYLEAGCGFGGSCFPKDVKALLRFSADSGYPFRILTAVESVNEAQKLRLVEKLEAHFGSLKGKTIALWGLAFKPKTDDMREAPAISIIQRLLAAGAKVQAYDPEAIPVAKKLFGNRVTYAAKSYEALSGADALTIVTEWNEFREPDFSKMKRLLRQPLIFDGRNIYDPQQMRTLGFTYFSIGRQV